MIKILKALHSNTPILYAVDLFVAGARTQILYYIAGLKDNLFFSTVYTTSNYGSYQKWEKTKKKRKLEVQSWNSQDLAKKKANRKGNGLQRIDCKKSEGRNAECFY